MIGSQVDSNIILGVTSDSGISSEYVEFEKYFQRITKQTRSNYKRWLESGLGKKERIEITFFGHSLDATDGDVIKDMVMHEKSLITIFYYDNSAYKQIVQADLWKEPPAMAVEAAVF